MKFSILKTKGFLFLTTMLFSVFFVNSINAQSGTTGISGTVTDSAGANVAGATVTLTDPEKNFSRSIVTSDSGNYSFTPILPGTYTLQVEKTGFKKYVQTGVQAAIDTPIEVNISLEVGNVGETVTVTADTIDNIINTQDATIGTNFQPLQIQQLPTELRNINNLLSLQPGVTREGYVNGGRSDQSNITLDGIDINDQQSGGVSSLSPGLNSVLRITAESIEEFRVTTSNPNANQGRSSGAQISLLTKSGTNDFRGAAFWVPRRTFGSANSFINNRSGIERPNINKDVYGGAIGGPIVKDRFFFFYSYEGSRENPGASVVSTVPLASLGQGILKFRDNNGTVITVTPAQFNTIYASAMGMNPIAVAALADAARRYPANDFSSGAGDNLNTAGFRFNANTSEKLNTHITRLDYIINKNQQLFFRGNWQNDTSTELPQFPDTPTPETWSHNTGFAIGHLWTIGSNKVNNFRYGLTRQAFTQGGDASQNSISFRFVFSPLNYTYSLSRVTPVQNFSDDFTWTMGRHTLQFGGNIRIIRNKRVDTGSGFDQAVINPSYYDGSGRSLLEPLVDLYDISTTSVDAQSAVAALLGRYSQYTANYNYDKDGTVLPSGTPIRRTFATEEYDMYVQDSWKVFSNLTLNLGLRYALSRPVYETQGYQIRPDIPLGEYFDRRVESAARGIAYNETLNFELAGPKNNAPGYYSLDTNNFQPRISAAWTPNFKSGFWGKLFGKNNESVFRGGFAMTNDYFGQQLAVTFNNLSSLGFLTSDTIAPNTYDVSSSLGPLFTGFGQRINNLPGMAPLANRFQTPADEDTRIEYSLDSTLQSPINYNWSFSYGRKLPHGLYIEASYVGRMARHLLAQRDIMAPNDLVDPRSGTDWYTAAGQLYDAYYSGRSVNSIAPIPYFENLFPQLAGYFDPSHSATQTVAFVNENFAFGDWTFLQLLLDDSSVFFDGPALWSNRFYQPQYAAFAAFSTVGKSNYHGANISIRQRFGESLILDFNYTYSKSLDDASGLQTSGAYGSAFILNAIRQQDSYARSDFDSRHVINANGIWQIPFGKNRKYFSNINSVANAFLGGWQLAGIFRWNTGLPFSNLVDLAGWATNWNLRSSAVRTRSIQTSLTRGGNGRSANLFSNLDQLARAVRPAKPGEGGDRNIFHGVNYSQLDMSLGKTFKMPWGETHNLQFRWEVFNVFNKQYLDEQSIQTFSLVPGIPFSENTLSEGSGEFSGIKGAPRRMQFVLRYSF